MAAIAFQKPVTRNTNLSRALAARQAASSLPEDPHYVDFIGIGGMISPGVAEVVGAGSPHKWDVRAGYAQSGATIVYTGRDLAKFSVEFTMWDVNQLPLWEAFAGALTKEVQNRAGQAWDIVHPLLNRPPINIKSVAIEDISQLTQDDHGMWKATIKFIEYRAPKKVLARPDSPTPDAVKPPPTAQTAADITKQKLLGQIAVLEGQ